MNTSQRIIKIPMMKDCRGNLAVLENHDNFPFDIERVFWIYNIPSGQSRGHHAHRTCTELLIALQGSLEVKLTDKDGSQTYLLDSPTEGLIIPPMCWCQMSNFAENTVCLCLASEKYDACGYINALDDFLKEVGLN